MKYSLRTLVVATLALVSFQGVEAQRYRVGDVVQNFTLTEYGTGKPVSLYDLEGKVIFLEWFAWWCPYCQAAKNQVGNLERTFSNGNVNGVPVVHIDLNLQAGNDSETQQFIDYYGLQRVWNDTSRLGASHFQSSGQPIFAIINGVANTPGHQQWELLYTRLGIGSYNQPVQEFVAAINSVAAALPVVVPSLLSSPASGIFPSSEPLTLSASFDSLAALQYQWFKDNEPIANSNSASHTIASPQLADSGTYRVVATNGAGFAESEPAEIEVRTSFADYLSDANVPSDLRGPNDDPDRDGMMNALEYLSRTDPTDAKSKCAPIASVSDARMEVTCRYDPNTIAFALRTQFSDTLDFATLDEPVEIIDTPVSDGLVMRTYRANAPLGSAAQFSRLSAEAETSN